VLEHLSSKQEVLSLNSDTAKKKKKTKEKEKKLQGHQSHGKAERLTQDRDVTTKHSVWF
jgi:hypothetical protein